MSDEQGWFAYADDTPMSSSVAQPGVYPGSWSGAYLTAGMPVSEDDQADPLEDRRLQLADVGRLRRRLVRRLVGAARADEMPSLPRLLGEHLGTRSGTLDVVAESWAGYEHVNVQRALDAWLADETARTHRLVGVADFQHRSFGLAELLGGGHAPAFLGPRPGNVARRNLPIGPDGQVLPCVQCGVYLVTEDDASTALLLRAGDPEMGGGRISVEIASTRADRGPEVAAELRRLVIEHNVFRHQVVSFGGEVFEYGDVLLRFHARPAMTEQDLVLPSETLESVRRQVVEVARHKERLLAAGQHLKRGILLHGPPGVGKTHTVRYLMSNLTRTTVVLLSGDTVHLVGAACSVARSLQPAMVVIEDVDLVAEERGEHPGHHPMLFQLLNEMDGLEADVDVVFVLTTNRADLLEPALAARPGRVDQAVELALPDLSARRRLFDLYRGRLDVEESGVDDVLARAEGVTASFVKELLRRAAVLAAAGHADDDGEVLRVTAADLHAAMDELLDTRNSMTRVLLGGGGAVGGADVELDD